MTKKKAALTLIAAQKKKKKKAAKKERVKKNTVAVSVHRRASTRKVPGKTSLVAEIIKKEVSRLTPRARIPRYVHDADAVHGPAFKLARIKARLTQVAAVRKLADLGVEVTQGWISKMEKGHVPLTPKNISNLCRAYDIDEAQFHDVVCNLRQNQQLTEQELGDALAEEIANAKAVNVEDEMAFAE